MRVSAEDLNSWLAEPEGERIEFKEAKANYPFEKLVHYCAALSNEGGGRIILGATDARPRRVTGTQAFAEPGRTAAGLIERLRIRVDWAEVHHGGGRVLIFQVPAHPTGVPIQADGVYWARSGDALVSMRESELRRIFDEAEPDHSMNVHPRAGLEDLDPAIVERFRAMWRRKSGLAALDSLSPAQLLADAELIQDGRPTYAAMALMGSRASIGRHLPQAELIFEYRASENAIAYGQRIEFREGFLGYLDEVWTAINLRNEALHYRDGLFMRDVAVFNETVVREAILNAVTHRDYRLPGSIFVKQYPRRLEIISPGGFPAGITADNIVRKQMPRNRRIAEACARCGLVERSGQGADRMFEETIRDGKARPDFSGTDDHEVRLTLRGDIRDPAFARFVEKAGQEEDTPFSLDELMALETIHREQAVSGDLRETLGGLLERGIVERIGRGRGVRFVLARRLYAFLGQGGVYTRRKGLDRNTQKALLLKHIRDCGMEGAKLRDMQDVLKELSRAQIQTLLRELRTDGKVASTGLTRAGRWFVASTAGGAAF